MYDKCRALVEWGRKEWANVNMLDRGFLFEKSFLRGIKKLQLQHMVHVRLIGQLCCDRLEVFCRYSL